MSIFAVIFVIVLFGFLLWVINRFVPMEGNFRMILNAVAAILIIAWLLNVFGILDLLRSVNVNGRVNTGNNRGVGCSMSEVGR